MRGFNLFFHGKPLDYYLAKLICTDPACVLSGHEIEYHTFRAIACISRHRLNPKESLKLIFEARRKAFHTNVRILENCLLFVERPMSSEDIGRMKADLVRNYRATGVFNNGARVNLLAEQAYLRSARLFMDELEDQGKLLDPAEVVYLQDIVRAQYADGGKPIAQDSPLDKRIVRAVEERLYSCAVWERNMYTAGNPKDTRTYWEVCKAINAMIAMMPSVLAKPERKRTLSRQLCPVHPATRKRADRKRRAKMPFL